MREEMATAVAMAAVAALLLWARRRRHQSTRPVAAVSSGVRLATPADIEWLAMANAASEHFLMLSSSELDTDQLRLFVLSGPSGEVLAAAQILVEPKCLRGGASAAHVCEVLLNATHASTASRVALLKALLDEARLAGCYKCIVDAPPAAVDLLSDLGFEYNSLFLVLPLEARPTSPGRRLFAAAPSYECKPRPLGVHPRGCTLEYTLRSLRDEDGPAGYLTLLAQLSQAPMLSERLFRAQLGKARAARGMHLVLVVDDPDGAQLPPSRSDPAATRIVACVSILFERLPPSNGLGGLAARIEDVVVDASARGTGLGRALITGACELAAERGATAATLNCSEANEPFYRKCGFARSAGGEACFARYLTLTGANSHTDL